MLQPDLINPSEKTYLLTANAITGISTVRESKVSSVATGKLYNLEDIQLDKKMTKHVGFSMSTYQNKGDPTFAQNSNWGELEKLLFNRSKGNEHLASGGGIDILDTSSRATIVEAVKRANGNVLRFSVEWADVEPQQGKYNVTAMESYVEAAKYIKSQGVTPVITLHHFVEPSWFSNLGAFEKEENIIHFIRFCAYAYSAMANHVKHIVTFNEPAVYATEGYILGDFPPNKTRSFSTHSSVLKNMFQAHVQIYDTIHSMAKDHKVKVGLTHQALQFIPSSNWNIVAVGVCSVMNYRFHELFMELVEKQPKKFDFFGVQYYSRPLIGGIIPDSICEKGGKMVDSMRFRFDPEGIKAVLKNVAKTLPKVPLWVTETGTAGNSDNAEIRERRGEYYARSLKAVSEAQREGVVVKAYLAWTLYGNFEWAHGYSKEHDFGVLHRRKFSKESKPTPGYQVIQKIFAKL